MNDQCSTILDRQVALVAKWARQSDTGAETFTLAEYNELAVIFRHDARELAIVVDCRGIDYPETIKCATCHGGHYVVRGYGPDEYEAACPDCCGDDDREPYHYADDDLSWAYAQTVAEAVA